MFTTDPRGCIFNLINLILTPSVFAGVYFNSNNYPDWHFLYLVSLWLLIHFKIKYNHHVLFTILLCLSMKKLKILTRGHLPGSSKGTCRAAAKVRRYNWISEEIVFTKRIIFSNYKY
jgi:hypothetical protein